MKILILILFCTILASCKTSKPQSVYILTPTNIYIQDTTPVLSKPNTKSMNEAEWIKYKKSNEKY